MPKFLVKGSYTPEGSKGLMKEGGSGRRAAVEKMLAGLGGKIESMYYALGADDVYVIADLPDITSAVALSLAANAGAGVRLSTTPLISVEELDAATKKSVAYRAPGA